MVTGLEIEAKLQGVVVPRCISGKVLSVHRRVLNLEGKDQLLISLVCDSDDMTDRAIQVPERFFDLSITPGTVVDGDVNRLRLGESVTILRHWGRPWSGRLASSLFPGAAVSEKLLYRRLEALRQALLAADPGYGALGLLSAYQGGDAFSRAIGTRLKRWDFASIVGLGIGFTPSGDDVLSGISFFLAIIRFIRQFTDRERALSIALEKVAGSGESAYLERTTAGGATLLSLTLNGSFAAYQLDLCASLLGPESFDSGAEVAGLKSHGESSGFDMATGLLWAAESCRK